MVDSPRVLVVGAGYAGLNATLHLADRRKEQGREFGIALLDRQPYHLHKIRLHEAALHGQDVTTDLDDLLDDDNVEVHQATATGLDFANRQVATSAGPLAYDYLLLALGSVTNFFNIPGLQEHALPLDTLGDATRLHGHLEQQFVAAAAATDPAERERRLRFVIGGAGYTGIELAGELADHLASLCDRFGVERSECDVLVVDAMPRILPVLDEEGAAYAAEELGKRGIRFQTGVKVTSCSAEGVTLEPGGLVPTATVVWSGGVRANPLIATAGAPTGKQGRLVVDTTLRVPDHPEVFAIGDCALALDPATNQPLPATAQLAIQEGEHAAENIVRVLAGEEPTPFQPDEEGALVSLGHRRAVGWGKMLGDRRLPLRGIFGGLAKRAAEAKWELMLWRETSHLDEVFG